MKGNPPGPKGHWLLGNLPEFGADALGFLRELTGYGDLASYRFGPFRSYHISHPDYFHQVLVTDARKFYKTRRVKQVLRETTGNGILTSDGEFWKRQRKLVQPAFHANRIGAYADTIVQLTDQMLADWQPGQKLDVSSAMSGLTVKIISKILFDAEPGVSLDQIQAAIGPALEVIDERFNQLMVAPSWLPTPNNRRLKKSVALLDSIIQRFIDDRRALGEDKGDLLSMLLAAQDEDGSVMTDQQVRDEAMTLFGAGHETTAVTLMWVWYLLSQHPDVEARLHQEVDRVLGDRPATLADLKHLPYTEMIVKEALRLYPPAWITTREVIEPVEIGGYTLAKGSIVTLCFYWLHRDPRFFDQPDVFDPERFSPANEASIPKYAYLPFGAGPRVCIGNALAMMEARLILATIAQRFRLVLPPGEQVVAERLFTLRPKGGLRMALRERENSLADRAALVSQG
jgi:cytochrome P450